MTMRPLKMTRFLCCVLIILANVGVQFFLFIAFGFTNLPSNVPDSPIASSRECKCPPSAQVEPSKDEQDVAITCGVPPINDPSQSNAPLDSSLVDKNRTNYLLVVLILSSVGGIERRNAIRETWMEGYRERRPSILVKFAIGTEGLDPTDHSALLAENKVHNDLLLLPNLKESYSNLTRKVLYSFIHLHKHVSFTYLMKCDDDTFIILDTILEELKQRTSKRSYYWGFFNGKANVKRKGKWEENSWFLCDYYLPYALGGGYILSHDLVGRIVSTADGLQFYNSEDVSVGVWLSPYEAERKHDVRFNTEFVSRGCRNVYIVSHKQSVDEMRKKYSLLKEKGVQCEREYQTRMSYEYKWDVEPSKCCEKKNGIP